MGPLKTFRLPSRSQAAAVHPRLGGSSTWTSKRAQNNGPISQNGEYRQYRVHYLGYNGGPGSSRSNPGPVAALIVASPHRLGA